MPKLDCVVAVTAESGVTPSLGRDDPRNVCNKAMGLAGRFEPRSNVDIIVSLDDMASPGDVGERILLRLVVEHTWDSAFWRGTVKPQRPRDHARYMPHFPLKCQCAIRVVY